MRIISEGLTMVRRRCTRSVLLGTNAVQLSSSSAPRWCRAAKSSESSLQLLLRFRHMNLDRQGNDHRRLHQSGCWTAWHHHRAHGSWNVKSSVRWPAPGHHFHVRLARNGCYRAGAGWHFHGKFRLSSITLQLKFDDKSQNTDIMRPADCKHATQLPLQSGQTVPWRGEARNSSARPPVAGKI